MHVVCGAPDGNQGICLALAIPVRYRQRWCGSGIRFLRSLVLNTQCTSMDEYVCDIGRAYEERAAGCGDGRHMGAVACRAYGTREKKLPLTQP
jgi:hypothetical protein